MTHMSDQELANRIKAHLIWDSRVPVAGINVTVNNSVATLTGTVPSYLAKTAAGEDARAVSGVNAVENRLQVEFPEEAEVPPDSEIAENVKQMLAWDADLDASKISVSVFEGIVTLRGTVDALWKRSRAKDDAYWVTGVVEVVNELAVVPGHRPFDEAIAQSIEAALERNRHVDEDKITVTVTDGGVTLSGVVADWRAWQAAYNTAVFTNGVVSINDELAIEPPQQRHKER